MAQYLQLTDSDLRAALTAHGFDPATVSWRSVPEGSVYTIYKVTAPHGAFALRFAPRPDPHLDALGPFEFALLEHLRARGVTVPEPIRTAAGEPGYVTPAYAAYLFSWLPGHHETEATITPGHCRRTGQALAAMHAAAADFAGDLRDYFNLGQLKAWAEALPPGAIPDATVALMREELDSQLTWQPPPGLPTGIIHADLFPDNVLFDGPRTGLIDFGAVTRGALVYDLAVTVSSWAFAGAVLVPGRQEALIAGYQDVRPLTAGEKAAWPMFLRRAAVRFTLTRIRDFELNPQAPGNRVEKDYRDFLARLTHARTREAPI